MELVGWQFLRQMLRRYGWQRALAASIWAATRSKPRVPATRTDRLIWPPWPGLRPALAWRMFSCRRCHRRQLSFSKDQAHEHASFRFWSEQSSGAQASAMIAPHIAGPVSSPPVTITRANGASREGRLDPVYVLSTRELARRSMADLPSHFPSVCRWRSPAKPPGIIGR